MSERFELSFKNKEVRMWFYLMGPTVIVGGLILLYGKHKYQYVQFSMLVIAVITFYLWRFLYRRKQKKEINNLT
ncbi:hypothetical protein MHH33_16515 [Paenisporosarcina sp. FSL H8-0542]|uniref:hypothetical protein n=1 Tax=Paenisporosarcina sp. FSL H8-0542 TaxID=2921401 RepID=UPI00315B348E